MFSMVLMVALTSGPERMDFHFHKNYGPEVQQHYCNPTCYSTCCSYAPGPGCYTGCCSYANCCSYSRCSSSNVSCSGCCSNAVHGGNYGVTSFHGGDVVNAYGGWGMPYATYAPLGDINLNNVAPMIYAQPSTPTTNEQPSTGPMKKVDDKTSDGKTGDSKNSDGKNSDSKGSDSKNNDGKNPPEKEENLKMESKTKNPSRAKVIVSIPDDSRLFIDDHLIKTTSTQKSFSTPVLKKGESYYYEIRVELIKDGQPITETRKVNIHAGSIARVDFRNMNQISTAKAR